MSLIEHLKQVRDFRTQPRYELWVVLLLVVMGVLSGCTGYRALADFSQRHQCSPAIARVALHPFFVLFHDSESAGTHLLRVAECRL